MPDQPTLFIAEYEGLPAALFSTRDLAKSYCDENAKSESGNRCWDWMPEVDGVQEQWWTHEDDDRPTYATGGSVTAVQVDEFA